MGVHLNPAAAFITFRESVSVPLGPPRSTSQTQTTIDTIERLTSSHTLRFIQLEAVIVVAVLLQILDRSLAVSDPYLHKRLTRHVWLGAIGGASCAVLAGAAILIAVWILRRDVLGDADEVF